MGKLEARIEKMVSKFIPKRVFARPLSEQVRIAEKMTGMVGMPTVRANLLKEGGLPADVRDLHKAGKTRGDIKAYYWDNERFRRFWQNMEMTEETLDTLIDDALAGVR